MPLYDNVNDLLKDVADIAEDAVIESFPDVQVVISHENGQEPGSSYIATYLLGISQTGRNHTSTLADENEYLTIKSHYEVRVQYSFVGSSAIGLALKFMQAINNNVVIIEALAGKNLTVLSKGDLKNVPSLRETKWVERYTLDVTYGLGIETQQLVTTVGTVRLLDPLTGQQISITEAP